VPDSFAFCANEWVSRQFPVSAIAGLRQLSGISHMTAASRKGWTRSGRFSAVCARLWNYSISSSRVGGLGHLGSCKELAKG